MTDPEAAVGVTALDKADPPVDNNHVAVAGRQGETHMGFARSIATILFIVALPVAIITTNVRLLMNAPIVYDYAFDRYDAEASTGLSRSDLDACAAELRRYFNNGEPTYYCTVTENGLPAPILSAKETTHMEDVKALVSWVNILQVVSVMFVVAYGVLFFVWSREGNLRELAGQSLASLLIGGLVIGAIAGYAAVGFDAAWERFHVIAFPSGNWLLNPRTDHLIQMFPEAFWRDAVFMLGGLILLQAALIAMVSGIYLISTKGERRQIAASIAVSSSTSQAA